MTFYDNPLTDAQYFFEGTEKNLKLVLSGSGSLMEVSRENWQSLLDYVNCKILSTKQNDLFHTYLLSESSLFVQKKKLVLKTCGETTLLHFMKPFKEFLEKHDFNLKIESLSFTRKTYLKPQKQPYPHKDFTDEAVYLDKFFGKKGLKKDFGSFFAYFNSYSDNPNYKDFSFFEMLMNKLSNEKMKIFYKKNLTAPEVSKKSGISGILDNMEIDDWMFDPCGYSCNGLRDETYFTIHVTPEEQQSYVSYECNAKQKDFERVSKGVVSTFAPGEFIVACLHKEGESFKQEINGYKLKSEKSLKLGSNFFLSVKNYFLNIQEKIN